VSNSGERTKATYSMNSHEHYVYPDEYRELKSREKRFVIVPSSIKYEVKDFLVIHEVNRETGQVGNHFSEFITRIQTNPVGFMGNPDLWVILFLDSDYTHMDIN